MNLRNIDKISLMKEHAITNEAGKTIEKYLDMLFTYNKNINLTGLDNHGRAWHELIAPALGFYRHIGTAESVADIGSGNGIPGIVIALMNENIKVTLIESRKNKVAFLHEVKYQLGLACEIIEDRAEKVVDRIFDCAVGFRVAELERFLAIAAPILSPDGFVVQYCPQLPEGKDGAEIKVVDKSGNVWYYQKGADSFINVRRCFT